MKPHPPRVEVGDDAVQIDPETHRDTLRTVVAGSTRRRARATIACLLFAAATACGGDDEPDVTRSYVLELRVDDSQDRYRYVADGPVDVRSGDEVTFELENTGTLIHDLQIVDPEGTVVAVAPPAAPGASLSLTALFEEPGFYRLNCLVDDHLTAHQMQTIVEVTDPTG